MLFMSFSYNLSCIFLNKWAIRGLNGEDGFYISELEK